MSRERYTPKQQEFYKSYLNSKMWRIRKANRIAYAGYRCEFVTVHHKHGDSKEVRCARTRYLCVHHNTYERLGREEYRDLDVFCWFHHMLEHLLWKKCFSCKEPCLGCDSLAELWLSATLAQMGINLDVGKVVWKTLPTKEQLAQQIAPQCPRCRGIHFTEDL